MGLAAILLVVGGVGYHLTEKKGQDTTLENIANNGLEGSKAQFSSLADGEDTATDASLSWTLIGTAAASSTMI